MSRLVLPVNPPLPLLSPALRFPCDEVPKGDELAPLPRPPLALTEWPWFDTLFPTAAGTPESDEFEGRCPPLVERPRKGVPDPRFEPAEFVRTDLYKLDISSTPFRERPPPFYAQREKYCLDKHARMRFMAGGDSFSVS